MSFTCQPDFESKRVFNKKEEHIFPIRSASGTNALCFRCRFLRFCESFDVNHLLATRLSGQSLLICHPKNKSKQINSRNYQSPAKKRFGWKNRKCRKRTISATLKKVDGKKTHRTVSAVLKSYQMSFAGSTFPFTSPKPTRNSSC